MDENPRGGGSGTNEVLRTILAVVAALALLAGFAGGTATVAMEGARGGGNMAMAVFNGLVIIFSGILICLLLWAISTIVHILGSGQRRAAEIQLTQDDSRIILGRLEQSLRTLPRGTDGPRPAAESRSALEPTSRQVSELLEQIRDFSLMDAAQKERFAARHWQRRKAALRELIERDALVGEWSPAFARLDDLQLLLPDDPDVKELRLSVETERAARLEEDLRGTRGQLRHLMGSALWQQAEELAGELAAKYPDQQEPAQLLEQVRREHENYNIENAQRLFQEVASATERRQWRLAIQTLEEFVRRYPNDPRATALRLDLPTLQENAAAQDRKEQEEHFKDMLKRQRYQEAIGVARAVMQKYPGSATAVELNKLLPRVEEFARQAEAQQQTAAVA